MSLNAADKVIGILLCIVASASAQVSDDANMNYLTNDHLRIGVDLNRGGAIAYLGFAGEDRNLINTHDTGRYIQQSYYSGPRPYGAAHPAWKDWPWNPIGAGDVYNHRATVLDHQNDGKTLYVKTRPMQWALDNVPGDCTFETWITLRDNVASVKCRLNNDRNFDKDYGSFSQELPAVYVIASLDQLVTYAGDAPFTNQPVTHIDHVGIPWTAWNSTECWSAFVGKDGRGVGLVQTHTLRWIGGFNIAPGEGDTHADATGYFAPVRDEILDAHIHYDYHYQIVLGSVDDIRKVARQAADDVLLDFHFEATGSRLGWTYRHARDMGLPTTGPLKVVLEEDDPQLLSPPQAWQADRTKVLRLRAAFRTNQPTARLFWRCLGDADFTEEESLDFPVISDGQMHAYQLMMHDQPTWRGIIVQLRLDPCERGGAGQWVNIRDLRADPDN
ncbi:MAG: hypothetical protein GC162_14995 [Planctomycetes bacterium]|nr:hypothetical protein [Planctomycetota bacterium]